MLTHFNKHSWLILACLGCLSIAVLSLVPGYLRPHTGAPGSIEHFAAYLLVSGAFALGLRSERLILAVALALMGAAGLFELIQIDIPGRNPGLTGFMASSIGVWMGLVLAGSYRTLARRLIT
jgi:VanZ family protein